METAYVAVEPDLPLLKAHLLGYICRPIWWAETVKELLHHQHHYSSSSPINTTPQLLFVGPGKAVRNFCKKPSSLLLSLESKNILTIGMVLLT